MPEGGFEKPPPPSLNRVKRPFRLPNSGPGNAGNCILESPILQISRGEHAHLVFHVSVKWGAALLVHHFVVRQRLKESQPLADFSSVSFNYSVYARSWPTWSPGCFFPGFEGGASHLQSKAREKRPSNEFGSWHCKLILLYSEAGFSVAFGSTGCSGSVGGRAPFAPLVRTLSGPHPELQRKPRERSAQG